MTTLRCSKLPLAVLCPNSVKPTEYTISIESEAARLGSAVHEYLSLRIKGDEKYGSEEECHNALACKYEVDVGDLRSLCWKAWRLWEESAKWFGPGKEVEVELSEGHLVGHVDVIYYNPETKTVFILDHKTGWLDSDYSTQLKGYGWLATLRHPEAEKVHLIVSRVREFATDHLTYTPKELEEWNKEAWARVSEDAYNPGPHCGYCTRWMTCQAYRDYVEGAVRTVSQLVEVSPDTAEASLVDLKAETVKKVYDAKKTLSGALDHVGNALKMAAVSRGGRLDYDEDYELVVATQVQQSIDYRMAAPVLAERLPAEAVLGCYKVDKEKVKAAIRDVTPYGKKAEAVAALMKELDDVGAMIHTPKERLEKKKRERKELATA